MATTFSVNIKIFLVFVFNNLFKWGQISGNTQTKQRNSLVTFKNKDTAAQNLRKARKWLTQSEKTKREKRKKKQGAW